MIKHSKYVFCSKIMCKLSQCKERIFITNTETERLYSLVLNILSY